MLRKQSSSEAMSTAFAFRYSLSGRGQFTYASKKKFGRSKQTRESPFFKPPPYSVLWIVRAAGRLASHDLHSDCSGPDGSQGHPHSHAASAATKLSPT